MSGRPRRGPWPGAGLEGMGTTLTGRPVFRKPLNLSHTRLCQCRVSRFRCSAAGYPESKSDRSPTRMESSCLTSPRATTPSSCTSSRGSSIHRPDHPAVPHVRPPGGQPPQPAGQLRRRPRQLVRLAVQGHVHPDRGPEGARRRRLRHRSPGLHRNRGGPFRVSVAAAGTTDPEPIALKSHAVRCRAPARTADRVRRRHRGLPRTAGSQPAAFTRFAPTRGRMRVFLKTGQGRSGAV